MKKKIIRLTESDLNNIIKECIKKVLKEDYQFDNFGGLSDAEYDELQQNIIDKYEQDDADMQADYDASMADMQDYGDENLSPSDGDLYMGMN